MNDPYWLANGGNGDYTIGMIIDSADDVFESDEINNSNQGELIDRDTLVINGTTLADLVGTSANVVLEPQLAGNVFDFDYSISNIGGSSTGGNYTVSFYLSDNDLISPLDQFLGSTTLSNLAAGASTGLLRSQLTLPGVNDAYWLANGGNGDYTIGMIIDSANVVLESDETNNSNQGELIDRDTLAISGTTAADLVGTSANVVQEPLTAGATFDFDYILSNIGGAPTGQPIKVSFYLSSNTTISSSDYFLGDATIANFPANASTTTLSQQLSLPPAGDPFWSGDGTYTIGMIVDSDDVVAEVSESNNSNLGNLIDQDSVLITGTQKADLVSTVSDVIFEPQNAGNTFSFEFEINNLGGLASGAFDVSFYLSTNDIISSADQFLGTATLGSVTANGSTGLLTVDLTLPGINDPFWQGDGTYFVGMLIDPNNAVDESNETNNSNTGFLLDYDDVIINNTSQLGQRGSDDFLGTDAADFFQGLRGDDDILGFGGDDELRGGRGDDFVIGGTGSDIVNGNRGDDLLIGVDLDNALNVNGDQIDILIGGFGDDAFILGDTTQSYYNSTSSTDYAVIADYTAGEDVIMLHGSAGNYSLGTPSVGLPGTGIFQGNELIAVVQGDTSGLSLTGAAFEYI
ncbi:aphp domain-containing protein [Leptolyngbya sp. Heron Island J]|uniref:CARDB domain-containing protein n=1 Tax=Leptolyngbya sp. Heron Island J TaxID=1385935 RepID=UPI0003B9CAE2|nr:CARDB domain-containing protein [Leptolyngbya sp. Heron Island J]ESA34313.1 aphp domain-containing protein [Leptolyngbya sp. Heron Island J]